MASVGHERNLGLPSYGFGSGFFEFGSPPDNMPSSPGVVSPVRHSGQFSRKDHPKCQHGQSSPTICLPCEFEKAMEDARDALCGPYGASILTAMVSAYGHAIAGGGIAGVGDPSLNPKTRSTKVVGGMGLQGGVPIAAAMPERRKVDNVVREVLLEVRKPRSEASSPNARVLPGRALVSSTEFRIDADALDLDHGTPPWRSPSAATRAAYWPVTGGAANPASVAAAAAATMAAGALRRELDEMRVSVEASRSEAARLRAAIGARDAQVETLSAQVARSQTEMQSLAAETSRLQDALRVANADRTTLVDRKSALEAELMRGKEQWAIDKYGMERKLGQLKLEVEMRAREHKSLRETVKRTSADRAAWSKDRAALIAEMSALQLHITAQQAAAEQCAVTQSSQMADAIRCIMCGSEACGSVMSRPSTSSAQGAAPASVEVGVSAMSRPGHGVAAASTAMVANLTNQHAHGAAASPRLATVPEEAPSVNDLV